MSRNKKDDALTDTHANRLQRGGNAQREFQVVCLEVAAGLLLNKGYPDGDGNAISDRTALLSMALALKSGSDPAEYVKKAPQVGLDMAGALNRAARLATVEKNLPLVEQLKILSNTKAVSVAAK